LCDVMYVGLLTLTDVERECCGGLRALVDLFHCGLFGDEVG